MRNLPRPWLIANLSRMMKVRKDLLLELAGDETFLSVLTWISIYYFSRAGPTASIRIYFEVVKSQGPNLFNSEEPTTIPLGHSYFPNEAVSLPRRYGRIPRCRCRSLTQFMCCFRWLKVPNLVFESEQDSGGHFAAFEKPKELVKDIRDMFRKGGPAFGVVKGKSGYV